jgi:methionyl-tRNA synthetase
MLNLSNVIWDDIGQKPVFKAGHVINKPEMLFEKIEDEAIEFQLNKLKTSKELNAKSISYTPIKDNITYDDFAKLDIRVVTVIAAERVPKTDKLLKITVDLGFEQRTVVSGVAHCYEPEQLIGKQVCLIANLEPRKIKGIESKGMILFAEHADKLVAISPTEAVQNGSIIK